MNKIPQANVSMLKKSFLPKTIKKQVNFQVKRHCNTIFLLSLRTKPIDFYEKLLDSTTLNEFISQDKLMIL